MVLAGGGLAGCGPVPPRRSAAAPSIPPAHPPDPSAASAHPPAAAVTGPPVRFGAPQPLTGGTALAAVACATTTTCLAVDSGGAVYRFDGSRWSGPVVPGGPRTGVGRPSVSCASATSCIAATDGGGAVERWDGQGWSGPVTLPGAQDVEAVGCAPSGYCAAVDAEGDAFSSDGGGWRRTSGDWGAATAVSCLSATWCMSSSGGLSHWDGSQWTVPDAEGASSSFSGVSCAATTFCMAVDRRGDAWRWDGTGWSGPTRAEPGRATDTASGPAPTSVSCPTASFCVAVDDAGAVLQWAAGQWTRTVVDGSTPLAAVSCPTASFCVAVDRRGDVLVGRS